MRRIFKNYPARKLELFSPKTGIYVTKMAYERWRPYLSFSEKVLFDVKYFWSTGEVWNSQFYFILLISTKDKNFGQKIIFWKVLVIQHFTCWIYLDIDLHFVFFTMQNYLVRREWNDADWMAPRTCFVFFITVFIGLVYAEEEKNGISYICPSLLLFWFLYMLFVLIRQSKQGTLR